MVQEFGLRSIFFAVAAGAAKKKVRAPRRRLLIWGLLDRWTDRHPVLRILARSASLGCLASGVLPGRLELPNKSCSVRG